MCGWTVQQGAHGVLAVAACVRISCGGPIDPCTGVLGSCVGVCPGQSVLAATLALYLAPGSLRPSPQHRPLAGGYRNRLTLL